METPANCEVTCDRCDDSAYGTSESFGGASEAYAAALVVYRLMESQEEADRMSEEFFWPETEEAPEPQVSTPDLDGN